MIGQIKPVICASVVLIYMGWSLPLPATEPANPPSSAAAMLPKSALVYLEVPQPKQLLAAVLDHPLRAKIEATAEYKQASATKQFSDVQFMVRVVEGHLGLDWRKVIEAVSEDGLAICIDLPTQGAALFTKCRDEAAMVKVRDGLMQLVRSDAKNKGQADPYKPSDYRGITAYKMNNGGFVTLGKWMVFTNKGELGKQIIDRYLDGGSDNLAADAQFQVAQKMNAAGKGNSLTWAYAPLATVREIAVREKKWKTKTDNPLAELLVGGILSTLDKAPYATANLLIDNDQIRVALSTPHQTDWAGPQREYYFGPQGRGQAPAASQPKDALASITAYRDIGKMWALASELFDEQTQQKMAKADTDLGGFFQGQEFGRDVLGAIKPEVEIVAARQTFSDPTAEPAIKLPSFALIVHLKEPEKMQPRMQASFQSLIGFTNVIGSQQGAPQLLSESEVVGQGKVIGSRYLLDDAEKAKKQGRINYNFTPSLGFYGDRMILSSTRQLAVELVTAAGRPATGSTATAAANTQASVNLKMLHDLLVDNRQHLVSQNMLEKGHDKAQAEKEIDVLLSLLNWLDQARLQLTADSQSLKLEMAIHLANK